MTGAFHRRNAWPKLARAGGVSLKPVSHENDIYLGAADIRGADKIRSARDVLINLFRNNGNNLGLPMMMEVAFAN